ncbi:MAG: hypothetical protein NUW37_16710 [Planctomycetes bacterium]|nr:hypothetical protein [Planctomycetota bacterium]
MKALFVTTITVLLLFALTVACGGGSGETAIAQTPAGSNNQGVGGGVQTITTDYGVALSPKGYPGSATNQDWIDFYTNHSDVGKLIAFHTNWRDSAQTAGQTPQILASAEIASAQYGFTPAIGIGWDINGTPDLTSANDPQDNTWGNAQTRQQYKDMVATFATQHQPKYLFLGNEVNSFWLSHPQAEWDVWVTEYRECYDAVKAASPDTIVFTVFQLERMKGVGVNTGWSNAAHWQLLDDVKDKCDAIGFTTYPYFEYTDPANVPANYYTEIADHYDGPVIFTEVGWVADPAIPFLGSEQKQADFIDVFFSRIQAFDVRYVCWLFLHDVPGFQAFSQIGLRDQNGVSRLSEARWKAHISG